jgi:hypothetical protein
MQCISGKNREAFLTEIGVSFHRFVTVVEVLVWCSTGFFSLLLDHLRKFPVSATGGLMLAK